MSRYRGQKALYEVIGRSRSKTRSNQGRLTELLHAPDAVKEKKAEPNETETSSAHNEKIRWEPRAIQFNSGHIELLLPYPVVFILVLGVLIVILAAFKLGQSSSSGASVSKPGLGLGQQNSKMNAATGKNGAVDNSAAGQTNRNKESKKIAFDGTVRPGNAVLIQEHGSLVDLVPVKRFFAENEIATEIIRTGTTFFLATKERFTGNPDKEGSPGFLLKQKIVELGTEYQAPPSCARFTGFSDAYGRYFKEQFQGEVVNVD